MVVKGFSERTEVEDERLYKWAEAIYDLEKAIETCPAKLKTGVDQSPGESNQIHYQRCGGGRRVIRKAIGGG